MKKQTVFAVLSALLLLSSCYTYTNPQWPVPKNDLLIAFPQNGEFYTYDDHFSLKSLTYEHFHNNGYDIGGSIISDKIYFGASDIKNIGNSAEPSYEVNYFIFSVELDGTGMNELYHQESILPEYDFYSSITVFGVYHHRLLFLQSRKIYMYDPTLQKIVFQSQEYVDPNDEGNSIRYYHYQYLGEDKLYRLTDEGIYVTQWNSTLQVYEEILYPKTLSHNRWYHGFFEGVLMIENAAYIGSGEYEEPHLIGVRYEDGTWYDEEECLAIINAYELGEASGLYRIDRNENQTKPLDITHTVTRKEDSLSRDLTKEYLIGLYPDLHKPYDTEECVLYEIIQQGENLYLSFSYYRSNLIQGLHYCYRIVFAYDFELETMSYLGFYTVQPYYPMKIVNLGN